MNNKYPQPGISAYPHILVALLFVLLGTVSQAQTITHSNTNYNSSVQGACIPNTCSGTYVDNGGAGANYTNDIGNFITICPNSPNSAIQITFSSFNLENGWDWLDVYNGASPGDPYINSYTGTALPPVLVSTSPSGCLTFYFETDFTGTRPGWVANVACVPNAAGPAAVTNADCLNSTYICASSSSFAGSSQGPGLVQEGCAGCIGGENYSSWYQFTVGTSGTLAFTITPTATADYDFALFQGASCGSLGTPVRCSFASTTGGTGLAAGNADTNEDPTGNGYVSPVNAVAGQTYYLLINNWDNGSANFNFNWAGTATIDAPPAPDFTFNSPVCVGSNINLNAPTLTNATYHWSGPNGFTSTAEDPVITSATAANGGNYSLYVVINGCTSGTTTKNIPVNAVPSIDPVGNQSLCAGAATTPIAFSGTGATGYNWTNNAPSIGLPASGSGDIASFTTSNNSGSPITATVTVTPSAGGCLGTPTNFTITVGPAAPAPTLDGNSPICEGSALNLTASGGTGTYVWSGPNGFTSTTQNPSISPATVANSGNYTAVYVTAGCTSVVATYNAVVNPTPATPTIGSNTPVCVGSAINLTAPAGAGTYVWSGPNGFTSSVQNPSIASATMANNGTYTLYLVTGGCTSTTASVTVNVINPPIAPTFTTNSPLCEGATLTLTGSFFPIVNYVWSGPNGYSATGQSVSIPSVTAAHAGNYTLVLTASGCTSSAAVQNVVVNPSPAAPVVGGNSPICAGDALNLTATGSGAGSYSWSGPNGFTSTTQNPAISPATAAATGSYNAVYIQNGCTSAVATYNVVVNAIPATPVASSNSPVCEGTTLNLSTPSVAGALYNWSGPNAFSSSTQNPSIASATAAASGTYSVTVTANGCASLAGSTTVTVTPPPATPVISSNSPVCENGTLQLGTTATATSYHWNGPAAWSSTSQNPVLPGFGSGQTGTYNLYVVSNGCTSSTATANIQVAPAPQVVYTGPAQICGNDGTFTASATVAAPAGINSVVWHAPGQIGTGTSINHQFTQAAPTTVSGFVVAVSSDNCLDSASFSIQLVDVPVADFTVQDLCDGESLQFHENHDWEGNETNTPGFSWVYNGTAFSTATDPVYNFGAPGTYTITLVATNPISAACSDTHSETVTVYPKPVLDFTYAAECIQDVQFTGTAAPDSVVTSYAWDFADGGTGTGSATTHAFQQTGLYQVAFTAVTANNCTTSVVKPVQIDQVSAELPPMPDVLTPNGDNLNDFLDMDDILGACSDYEFIIFNRWGNTVHRQLKGGAPFIGKSTTGSTLSAGVYFYTLILNDIKHSGSITLAR